MHDNEDFYRFTRARFVQNEAHEMASRYIRFDVEELAKVAAGAVGSKSCVGVEKFADGMHNKALLLTMENGMQVVAKIPNPNAGQAHFTTASEVATMEVMRDYLSTPVPKVYAWCSHAKDSPVGAEYIIMDKATGVPLKSVWYRLGLPERFAVAKQIAHFQGIWSSASYEGYGSIYYASDLPEQHRLMLSSYGSDLKTDGRFALGPTTGRDWNDDGREVIGFDRGPCKLLLCEIRDVKTEFVLGETLENYLEAIGRREVACVKELARLPPTQVTLCGPGTYLSTRAKKLQALQYYLQLVKYLAPTETALRHPSAWHADLHIENIFVDPAAPTKVTCIIDWQSTEVAPLFVQARQPYMLDHSGPQVKSLERPRLPNDFTELSPEQQKTANRLLLDQALCVGYKRWIQSQHPDIWKCFEFQETPEYELLLHARNLLIDGEALYMARIIELLRSKDSILQGSGLYIPEHVIAEAQSDTEGALRGMEAMSEIQEVMGNLFPERGCVRHGEYEEAKDALRQCKEQIVDRFASTPDERAAWEESWPFDD